MRVTTLPRLVVLVACLVLLTAACGGGDEETTDGVASVSDLDETEENATAVAASVAAEEEATSSDAATAEEAALAVSACMRENGFEDFPDPVIGDNGAPNLRAAIAESGVDFTDPSFREQIETCVEDSGAANFGTGARGNFREQIQEQLLGYTQCLRDEGLDVGDLGAPGQGQGQGAQGDDGAGRPQRGPGNLEDRSERIASALGLDVDDPDTAAALEACDSVLTEAFAGIVGGPGAGPAPADG